MSDCTESTEVRSRVGRNERRHEIVYRPLNELRLDPKNPRSHTANQIRKIAKSIREFGFVVAILVDRAGNIVAGHGRFLAAQLLGMAFVPTVCLDHLDAAQIRAFQIADNRLSEIGGEWSERLLAEALQELSLLNLDFDLDVTGFELPEIDLRIQSLTEPEAAEDPADVVPTPSGPVVTAPGDLWLLGEHRLICGSALDAATYETLLAGDKASLVFTDPPYNVPVSGSCVRKRCCGAS